MALEYRISPPLDDATLNALFAAAWRDHRDRSFAPVLARSLVWVAAFDAERLVGFVNVVGDGGVHAFLLDTTVAPDHQRRGVGLGLVRRAAQLSRERGAEWLHVDCEAELEDFYRRAGFRHTAAGLMDLGAP